MSLKRFRLVFKQVALLLLQHLLIVSPLPSLRAGGAKTPGPGVGAGPFLCNTGEAT